MVGKCFSPYGGRKWRDPTARLQKHCAFKKCEQKNYDDFFPGKKKLPYVNWPYATRLRLKLNVAIKHFLSCFERENALSASQPRS